MIFGSGNYVYCLDGNCLGCTSVQVSLYPPGKGYMSMTAYYEGQVYSTALINMPRNYVVPVGSTIYVSANSNTGSRITDYSFTGAPGYSVTANQPEAISTGGADVATGGSTASASCIANGFTIIAAVTAVKSASATFGPTTYSTVPQTYSGTSTAAAIRSGRASITAPNSIIPSDASSYSITGSIECDAYVTVSNLLTNDITAAGNYIPTFYGSRNKVGTTSTSKVSYVTLTNYSPRSAQYTATVYDPTLPASTLRDFNAGMSYRWVSGSAEWTAK